jgi:hypothetical protein
MQMFGEDDPQYDHQKWKEWLIVCQSAVGIQMTIEASIASRDTLMESHERATLELVTLMHVEVGELATTCCAG